jgi:hypothetical protein
MRNEFTGTSWRGYDECVQLLCGHSVNGMQCFGRTGEEILQTLSDEPYVRLNHVGYGQSLMVRLADCRSSQ